MNFLSKIVKLKRKISLKKYKKMGMVFSEDLSLMSMPDFGSEPYLISLGKHVRICSNVKFITHDGSTWVFREKPEYKDVVRFGQIRIGDNCFIGDNVTILPNVVIGDNCIIGVGAVVTSDIPDNSVAVGVPAKVISSVDEFARKCKVELPTYDVEDYHIRPKYWITYLADSRMKKSRRLKK